MAGSAAPHLAAFLSSLRSGTAAQYASCVRAFFRAVDANGPADVTRAQLVDYCAGIAAPAMRSKTTSALDAYFSYLEENGHLERHPAHGLARRVADARTRDALLSELRLSGVSAERAANLRWRDVAQDAVGAARVLPKRLSGATRARLVNGLLERLRTASADTIAAVLDGPVLTAEGAGAPTPKFRGHALPL